MEAKARINLKDGLIELEGSESFVSKHLDHFKELADAFKKMSFNGNEQAGTEQNTNLELPTKPAEISSPKPKKNGQPKKPSVKSVKQRNPQQLFNLNFRPSGKVSLRDFFSQFESKSNLEKNVIYAYYLKRYLEIEKVTLDHIYTCYKETNQKVPENIYQSLIDTKNKKGWIDTQDIEDITMTVTGDNYIEHDAPRVEVKA